ncbi:MAG: S41 family peptidase [Alistipes indistinctus]
MFAIVLFTYPDSPAAKAGIKRGDIFIRVNNMEITMSTYMNLFRFPNVSLQYGHLEGNTIYPATRTTTLTGTEMYLDPVITYSVIDRAGHKIGYLCYSDFVSKSIGRLEEVFSTFQQQQVTEIILDLRYNPGGEVSAMAKLSSMLAPKSAVESHSVPPDPDLQQRVHGIPATDGDRRERLLRSVRCREPQRTAVVYPDGKQYRLCIGILDSMPETLYDR